MHPPHPLPPVCFQKWHVCIQGIKWWILLGVFFSLNIWNSNYCDEFKQNVWACNNLCLLIGWYVPHIEAGTGVCSLFALSRLRFSLECVLVLFCVNFTSECQSATLSRDRSCCRVTVISCWQTLQSLHFFMPSLREGVCIQRWWLFQQFEFSCRLPTVLLFGCYHQNLFIQNLK